MARNTQKNLADALKRLMDRKELDAITVQELADEANVNKKTFYYHFHGISDLLGWMYTAELYSIIDAGVTPQNWTGLVRLFLSVIRRERRYITAIFTSSYAALFQETVYRMFERALEKYVHASRLKYEAEHGVRLALTQEELLYIGSYQAMAIYGVIERWSRRDMKESDEELVRIILTLASGSVRRSFERFSAGTTGDKKSERADYGTERSV